jgi:hypothetical protein
MLGLETKGQHIPLAPALSMRFRLQTTQLPDSEPKLAPEFGKQIACPENAAYPLVGPGFSPDGRGGG